MLAGIEEVVGELSSGEDINERGLPPGFRFHPTDEELITFYLASKVFQAANFFSGIDIAEVDLNRCEPWELPEVAKMGEKEWYFFSLRDRKYPTGIRTNRATGAGYWKATGKDREVYSSTSGRQLVGMKKTLVFYKGRAPRGLKTKWVMHEYRLDGHFSRYRHICKEEWVICRIFHKSGDQKKNPLLLLQGQIHPLLSTINSVSSCKYYLPPLLDQTPTTTLLQSRNGSHDPPISPLHSLKNPYLEQNELIIKSLQSSVVSSTHSNHLMFPETLAMHGGLQQGSLSPADPSPSIMTARYNTVDMNNDTSPSSLSSFKSLLSHQDFIHNDHLNQRQSSTQLPAECDFPWNWPMDKILCQPKHTCDHYHPQTQNPLLFEMDFDALGCSASATNASDIAALVLNESTTTFSHVFNVAGFNSDV